MGIPIRHRQTLADSIANCVAITDLQIVDAGATAFKLSEIAGQDLSGIGQFGPDFFLYDGAGTYFQIRTAALGGGTLLTIGVLGDGSTSDVYVSEKDNYLSTLLGVDVYSELTVSNASYQSGNLFINCKDPGSLASPQDLNNITSIVISKAADYVQPDMSGFLSVEYICGAATKQHTLPDATKNRNLEVEISKGDSGYGPVMIVTAGGTINGLAVIFLWSQFDTIRLKSNGTNYRIINDFKPYFCSEWVPNSDWTNRSFGLVTITYDNGSGALQIGDKITGANGSYGICTYKTATTVELANLVAVGANIFSDNEAISGDRSGATALVNMASHVKNADCVVYHGWGKSITYVETQLFISTDKTEGNTYYIGIGDSRWEASFTSDGSGIKGIDTNSFKIVTGSSGVVYTAEGTQPRLTNQDQFYKTITKLFL